MKNAYLSLILLLATSAIMAQTDSKLYDIIDSVSAERLKNDDFDRFCSSLWQLSSPFLTFQTVSNSVN